jgi:hypothetical protein
MVKLKQDKSVNTCIFEHYIKELSLATKEIN